MIERIKAFLKQNGLDWTGKISTMYDDDFRTAEDKDFKEKDIYNLLISFEEGNACLSVEIDLVSFYVLGEFKDIYFDKFKRFSLFPYRRKGRICRMLALFFRNGDSGMQLLFSSVQVSFFL